MKKVNFIKLFFALLSVSFIYSCGGDDPKPMITGEALFTVDANGLTVTFTNTSTVTGTTTNLWDFGDGETSTDVSPVHTYAHKGEYTVNLTVNDEAGKDHNVSTKVTVDKNSPVKLDDNSFDDWAAISDAFTIADDAGSVKSFKYDFDSDFIYFYIKQEKTFTAASIFDMLIDIDPDATTGYLYGLWPLFGGAELLVENSFATDKNDGDLYWLDFASYDANGSDWDTFWIYDAGNTADAQTDGTYSENGSVVEMEFAVSRTKIPALKDKEKIKIVAWTSDQDWNEIGWMPNKASVDNPDTDGIIIDMQ